MFVSKLLFVLTLTCTGTHCCSSFHTSEGEWSPTLGKAFKLNDISIWKAHVQWIYMRFSREEVWRWFESFPIKHLILKFILKSFQLCVPLSTTQSRPVCLLLVAVSSDWLLSEQRSNSSKYLVISWIMKIKINWPNLLVTRPVCLLLVAFNSNWLFTL